MAVLLESTDFAWKAIKENFSEDCSLVARATKPFVFHMVNGYSKALSREGHCPCDSDFCNLGNVR